MPLNKERQRELNLMEKLFIDINNAGFKLKDFEFMYELSYVKNNNRAVYLAEQAASSGKFLLYFSKNPVGGGSLLYCDSNTAAKHNIKPPPISARMHSGSKKTICRRSFKGQNIFEVSDKQALQTWQFKTVKKTSPRVILPSDMLMQSVDIPIVSTETTFRQKLIKSTKPAYKDFDSTDKRAVNCDLATEVEDFLHGHDRRAVYFDGALGTTTTHLRRLIPDSFLHIVERDTPTVDILRQKFPSVKIYPMEFQHYLETRYTGYENVFFADYMCTLDGNKKDSPLKELKVLLDRNKRSRIVLAMTFAKRGSFHLEKQSVAATNMKRLKKLIAASDFKIASEHTSNYSKHASTSMCYFRFNLVRKASSIL